MFKECMNMVIVADGSWRSDRRKKNLEATVEPEPSPTETLPSANLALFKAWQLRKQACKAQKWIC